MSTSGILEWLKYIPPAAPPAVAQEDRSCARSRDECRKRSKHSHGYGGRGSSGDSFTHPYNTRWPLNTPPETEAGLMAHQSTPTRRQKRCSDDLDLGEGDDDPTPIQQHRQQHRPRPTPKKAKSDSKTRDYLLKLETPVHVKPWNAKELAARPSAFQQIEHLYDEVLEVNQWRRGVVPGEIREQFTATYKRTHRRAPLSDCFRQPDLSSADSDDFTPADHAKAELILLRKILRQAILSKTYQRNECGWNAHVHGPLLHHAFQGQDEQTETEQPSVRVETIMTATMEGDSIPLRRSADSSAAASSTGLNNSDLLSEFCVTVTASSASSAFTGVVEGMSSSQRNLAHLQSRSDIKIVDYGLILDLPEDCALQETLSDIATKVCIEGGRRHINQTAYQSIQDSLIAVSIETKTELSAVDPLLQLGVWTAAWYKRMSFLRREVFATSVAPVRDEQQLLQHRQLEQQRRLVPVPLIAVVGHQWDLYFACFDAAKSITIYGPVKMGCTESILDLYVLVASLKAIREWVQDTFKPAMEDWFGVDARAFLNRPAQQWSDCIHPAGV